MELLLVLIFLVAVVVLMSWQGKRQQAAFEDRFPPLSDAEFVARCSPGTDPEVALRVRRIVANSLGVAYERVYPSTNFMDDLGVE